ncbi:MAG: hypothetical protein ACRD29_16935, partial [Acidimicrobiales bacterium]
MMKSSTTVGDIATALREDGLALDRHRWVDKLPAAPESVPEKNGIAGYAIAGFVIVEGLRAMALDPGLIPLVHTFALVRGRIPP